jgi:hypothetical protein
MERIDRNNYETFFIDYLDGSIPIEEIDLLLDFLTENPDLAEELKELEKIKLQPPNLSDFNFQHLKKTDLDLVEVFEETCIRVIENELSPNEFQNFQEYLSQNEVRQETFELFRSTVSEPDPFVIYDQKNTLKKKTIVFKYWYAVAAIFILGLMFFLPADKEPLVHTVAQVAKSNEIKGTNPVELILKNETTAAVIPIEKNSFIANKEKVQEMKTEEMRKQEVIEPMKPIFSEVQIDQVFNDEMKLAVVEKSMVDLKKDYSKYLTINEFLTKKVDGIKEKEKDGFFGKMALNTLKKVTGKKFDYTTTKGGKINKFEFNSKLLAFSIPVNSPEN